MKPDFVGIIVANKIQVQIHEAFLSCKYQHKATEEPPSPLERTGNRLRLGQKISHAATNIQKWKRATENISLYSHGSPEEIKNSYSCHALPVKNYYTPSLT